MQFLKIMSRHYFKIQDRFYPGARHAGKLFQELVNQEPAPPRSSPGLLRLRQGGLALPAAFLCHVAAPGPT